MAQQQEEMVRLYEEQQARMQQKDLELQNLSAKVANLQAALNAQQNAQEIVDIAEDIREKMGDDQQNSSVESKAAVTRMVAFLTNHMEHKDKGGVKMAPLKNAALTDQLLTMCTKIFLSSRNLEMIDLSNNDLTMDSVKDIAMHIEGCKNLQSIDLGNNKFGYHAVCYLMTAIMQRNNISASQNNPEFLYLNMKGNFETQAKPEAAKTFTNELWKFLITTNHPQVKDLGAQPQFDKMEATSIAKMRDALKKIHIMNDSDQRDPAKSSVTADMLLNFEGSVTVRREGKQQTTFVQENLEVDNSFKTVIAPTETLAPRPAAKAAAGDATDFTQTEKQAAKQQQKVVKAKATTFNMQQVISKNKMVLMALLDHMLETTSIEAKDNMTGMTLLEYSCHNGNMGLAKLCYRRGANLSAVTQSGSTPICIAAKKRKYNLMEFLYSYGVKINSSDAMGRTALHTAVSINDLDGMCRLVEWGASVSLVDSNGQTPLHLAAMHGHMDACIKLLELSASLNPKDHKNRTPADCASLNDHFEVYDRLIAIGAVSGMNGYEDYTATLTRSEEILGNQRTVAALAKKHGGSMYAINNTFISTGIQTAKQEAIKAAAMEEEEKKQLAKALRKAKANKRAEIEAEAKALGHRAKAFDDYVMKKLAQLEEIVEDQ